MPSVYTDDNYSGRVSLAAAVIIRSGEATRSFDTCFEMYDGDAVATALYRRAQKDPDGKLARNLWRYLGRATVEATALENAHRDNLSQWARELREQGKARSEAMFAEMRAKREAKAAEPYRVEFTSGGEQMVIPGCESPQLDLF